MPYWVIMAWGKPLVVACYPPNSRRKKGPLSRLRLILPVFCVCGRLSLGLLLYITSKSLITLSTKAFCLYQLLAGSAFDEQIQENLNRSDFGFGALSQQFLGSDFKVSFIQAKTYFACLLCLR
jgi:hypothetical protein